MSVGDDGASSTDPAMFATVSSRTGQVVSTVALPGHAEGFDFVPGTDLIIANIPDADSLVVVVDRRNSSIVASFKLPQGSADNVPLALDARRRRIMVGCHNPPSLLVLDFEGAQVFSGPAPVDLDDMWFDDSAELLFMSGGGAHLDGSVAVYATPGAGGENYTYLGAAQPGGKNSMVDFRTRKLYVTVPAASSASAAFIQVYSY